MGDHDDDDDDEGPTFSLPPLINKLGVNLGAPKVLLFFCKGNTRMSHIVYIHLFDGATGLHS